MIYNFLSPVSSISDLPLTGNSIDDCKLTIDTGHLYVWDGSSWQDQGNILNKFPYSEANNPIDLNNQNLLNIRNLNANGNIILCNGNVLDTNSASLIIGDGNGGTAFQIGLGGSGGINSVYRIETHFSEWDDGFGNMTNNGFILVNAGRKSSALLAYPLFSIRNESDSPNDIAFQVGDPILGSNYTKTLNNILDDNIGNASFSGHVGIHGNSTSTSPLNIKNLPTSSSGLVTGDIWNNNGILSIVS